MRVLNETRLECLWTVGKIAPPAVSATFFVKGTFSLRPNAPAALAEIQDAVTGDLYDGDDPQNVYRYPSDFALFKPRADLLVAGHCYAPGGKLADVVRASFSVGSFSKSLAVIGDRAWRHGRMSDPEPFEKIELSYGNSFGGPGYESNPLGKGCRDERLPNIEDPANLIRSPEAKARPAGFGPIPLQWPQRRKKAGTFNEEWLKTRWPWLPKDADPSFHNTAPEDQQLEGYLKGDESLRFVNLHPRRPIYESRLPGLRVRAFFSVERGSRRKTHEVAMNLDTLYADLDGEKLILVWRGVTALRGENLDPSDALLLVTETTAETPKAAGYYVEVLDEKLSPEEEDEEYPAEESEEAPAPPPTVSDHLHSFEAADAEPPTPASAAPTSAARRLQALGIAVPTLTPEEEDAAVMDENPMPPPQPIVRDRAWCLERIARGGDLADLDLTGVDLSGAELPGVSFRNSTLTEANLREANLAGADIHGAVLARADLRGVQLPGSDLTGADLTSVRGDGADFTEARMERVVLEDAGLRRARLAGIQANDSLLSRTNLWGADLREAHLLRADLSGALLHEADLSGADLSEATLEGAQGNRVKARGATLTAVRAAGVSLGEVDLTNAKARNSVWQGAKLYQACARGADFEAAEFEGAYLAEARLAKAGLKHARLVRANLRGAELVRTNLFDANLQGCDLSGANAAQANLFKADLFGAVLDRTLFEGANLKRAHVRRA